MTDKRFTVHALSTGRVFVLDDDFHYDAELYLTGDFGVPGEKLAYAAAVADALNAADIPTGRQAMTDHTYLIEKLRGYTGPWLVPAKAADALAALVKERDTARSREALADKDLAAVVSEYKTMEARVKRLEDALREVASKHQICGHSAADRCAACITRAALAEGDKP